MDEALLGKNGQSSKEYGSFFGELEAASSAQPKVVASEEYLLVDLDAPEWGQAINRSKQVIGVLGSTAIFMNAIVGPGFLSLPKLYHDSGLLVPTGLLVAGFAIAVLATVVRSETVALMPGNARYSRIVEFCDPALKFVGRRTFYLCHVLFYVASMATVIASIVLVSQSLDLLIAHIVGQSYAFTLNGDQPLTIATWNLSQNCKSGEVCKPFFTGHQMRSTCFISLGYATSFALLYPVSTERLSEGMGLQFASLIAMAVAVPILVGKDAIKIARNGPHALAAIALGPRALDASGVVLFNMMYGIFVSTWLSEKAPEVSVKRVVCQTSTVSCCIMIVYGIAGALATRNVAINGLLEETEQGAAVVAFAAAVLFGIFVIASGVPVACVMARHNLVSSPVILVTDSVASILCVVAPWATAWLFSPPEAYKALLNYTGLFVVSWLALWMPFFLLLARHDPIPHDAATPLAYAAWFCRQLCAPPDPEIDTVLFPLPAVLLPYSRRIYAAMLLLLSVWIFACLASYLVWIAFFFVQGASSTRSIFA